ncbi:methyl-accepting chemotaxis protein [Alkalicoccus chagannorensis]|uniref:methyl-accepting chemotaxis protein n=1 Tax=Alkalicoccus chagannorensis TaxID=427072 RepID=UPI00040B9C1B|nr:methyl-accepting chemotaxis protein [Alkalicoccus chagannorensis]
MSILHTLKQSLPYMQALQTEDCFLALTDTTTFVSYLPGKTLDIHIENGTPFREGGMNDSVIRKQRRLVMEVDKQVYGIPYAAVGIPLFEEGHLVGCLTMGVSTDRFEQMREMAGTLDEAAAQMTNHAEEANKDARSVAEANDASSAAAREAVNQLEEMKAMTSMLQGLTRQTTVLGFNASIEAARAGDAGRGFQVVAEEIRRFATTTAEATEKITDQIQATADRINRTQQASEQASTFTSSQHDRMEQLSGISQELKGLTTQLKDLSDQVRD